jgi:hypothetical protein
MLQSAYSDVHSLGPGGTPPEGELPRASIEPPEQPTFAQRCRRTILIILSTLGFLYGALLVYGVCIAAQSSSAPHCANSGLSGAYVPLVGIVVVCMILARPVMSFRPWRNTMRRLLGYLIAMTVLAILIDQSVLWALVDLYERCRKAL